MASVLEGQLILSVVSGMSCIMSASLSNFEGSFSILPALCLDGLICSDVRAGTFDGNGFLEFLDTLLVLMSPYPAP